MLHECRRKHAEQPAHLFPCLMHPSHVQKSAAAPAQLPASLKNNVVLLEAPRANGGTTKVYLMGVSHVSKVQAEQVRHASGAA